MRHLELKNRSLPGTGQVVAALPSMRGESLEAFAPETDMPLDPGIRRAVLILRQAGIETFESCEGGVGHAFPEPTIRFHGSAWAGYRAFAAAMENGLPVARIYRVYTVEEGQLAGPWWEMVLSSRV